MFWSPISSFAPVVAQGVLKRFCRPAKHAACVKIVIDDGTGRTNGQELRGSTIMRLEWLTWY